MDKIQEQFFYFLEKAIKSYRQFAQNELKKNNIDITVDQWLVMKALHDNPGISQVELAELVFKDKASITRILNILSDHGYISRETDDADKRQSKVVITPKGKKLLKQISPVVSKYRQEALQEIDRNDISVSEKVLKTIIKNSIS